MKKIISNFLVFVIIGTTFYLIVVNAEHIKYLRTYEVLRTDDKGFVDAQKLLNQVNGKENIMLRLDSAIYSDDDWSTIKNIIQNEISLFNQHPLFSKNADQLIGWKELYQMDMYYVNKDADMLVVYKILEKYDTSISTKIEEFVNQSTSIIYWSSIAKYQTAQSYKYQLVYPTLIVEPLNMNINARVYDVNSDLSKLNYLMDEVFRVGGNNQ